MVIAKEETSGPVAPLYNIGDVAPCARHLLMIGVVSGSSRNVVGRTSLRTIDCA
jgi:hypothetical protein